MIRSRVIIAGGVTVAIGAVMLLITGALRRGGGASGKPKNDDFYPGEPKVGEKTKTGDIIRPL